MMGRLPYCWTVSAEFQSFSWRKSTQKCVEFSEDYWSLFFKAVWESFAGSPCQLSAPVPARSLHSTPLKKCPLSLVGVRRRRVVVENCFERSLFLKSWSFGDVIEKRARVVKKLAPDSRKPFALMIGRLGNVMEFNLQGIIFLRISSTDSKWFQEIWDEHQQNEIMFWCSFFYVFLLHWTFEQFLRIADSGNMKQNVANLFL